ncbi:MAG: hypothetical protein J6K05_04390 [Bacteroidaceae bacterium]|nr:hypothetical protein [Bacteroidaceae bacterium]
MMDDFEDRMDDYFEYKIVSGDLDDEEKDRKKEDKDKNSTTEGYDFKY